MKYYTAYSALIVFLVIFSTATRCQAPEIALGITYARTIENEQIVHTLIVDPDHASFVLSSAQHGAEKPSSMAQRTGAIAALNAHFFSFGTHNRITLFLLKFLERVGYPIHTAYPSYGGKINNQWLSISPMYTGALGWNAHDNCPTYGTLKNTIELHSNNSILPITELNKPHTDGPILYTSHYGSNTPWHYKKTTDIVVHNNSIIAIHTNKRGSTAIPHDGYVIVVPHKDTNQQIEALKAGMPAQIIIASSQQNPATDQQTWESMEYIVGSTPLLIKDGAIVPYVLERTSTFYTLKHPRSAVGLRADGHWVFVVVEGNDKNTTGYTLPELAHYMQQLGCSYALNLCGGKSSSMVIKGQKVNAPTDKERPGATALLIMPKTQPADEPYRARVG